MRFLPLPICKWALSNILVIKLLCSLAFCYIEIFIFAVNTQRARQKTIWLIFGWRQMHSWLPWPRLCDCSVINAMQISIATNGTAQVQCHRSCLVSDRPDACSCRALTLTRMSVAGNISRGEGAPAPKAPHQYAHADTCHAIQHTAMVTGYWPLICQCWRIRHFYMSPRSNWFEFFICVPKASVALFMRPTPGI